MYVVYLADFIQYGIVIMSTKFKQIQENFIILFNYYYYFVSLLLTSRFQQRKTCDSCYDLLNYIPYFLLDFFELLFSSFGIAAEKKRNYICSLAYNIIRNIITLCVEPNTFYYYSKKLPSKPSMLPISRLQSMKSSCTLLSKRFWLTVKFNFYYYCYITSSE